MFAFISWLALKDRLATGVRTRCWGGIQSCRLCGEPDEKRDHFFVGCHFSFTVWLEVIGTLFGVPPNPDWSDTMDHMLHHSFDRDSFILVRLAFQSTIYYIWKEQNARKHNGTSHSPLLLARLIDKTIRNRVYSL